MAARYYTRYALLPHLQDILQTAAGNISFISLYDGVARLLAFSDRNKSAFKREVRFQVLTAESKTLSVFIRMMEAAGTYETSVNFYQTTRRNDPKDSHLHTFKRVTFHCLNPF
jgi:hypothetical protein